MQKLILSLLIILFTGTIHAEGCPSVRDLKANIFHEWRALDIDNATPLSNTARADFRQQIKKFALAEWMQDAPEGAAHCYYRGEDDDYVSAFLVKTHLVPDNLSHAWRTISSNIMQCDATLSQCHFTE